MTFDFPSPSAKVRIDQALRDRVRLAVAQEIAPFSRTLASAIQFRAEYDDLGMTVLGNTGYWWYGILDRGRGPVAVQSAPFLIWFADPVKDDPRIQGGYKRTERETRLRRLTNDEFKFWNKQNKIALDNGQLPPMIVRRAPSRPFPGYKFSAKAGAEGTAALTAELSRIVAEDVTDFLRAEARKLFGSGNVS